MLKWLTIFGFLSVLSDKAILRCTRKVHKARTACRLEGTKHQKKKKEKGIQAAYFLHLRYTPISAVLEKCFR